MGASWPRNDSGNRGQCLPGVCWDVSGAFRTASRLVRRPLFCEQEDKRGGGLSGPRLRPCHLGGCVVRNALSCATRRPGQVSSCHETWEGASRGPHAAARDPAPPLPSRVSPGQRRRGLRGRSSAACASPRRGGGLLERRQGGV